MSVPVHVALSFPLSACVCTYCKNFLKKLFFTWHRGLATSPKGEWCDTIHVMFDTIQVKCDINHVKCDIIQWYM